MPTSIYNPARIQTIEISCRYRIRQGNDWCVYGKTTSVKAENGHHRCRHSQSSQKACHRLNQMLGVLWCSKGPSNPIATCNAYIVRGWTDAWRLSISLLSVRSTWCPLFRNRGIKRWVFCCIRLNDRSIPMTMIGWKDEFSWHDCLHLFLVRWRVFRTRNWVWWMELLGRAEMSPHVRKRASSIYGTRVWGRLMAICLIRLFLFQLLSCNQR